jgi:hypothetical protein
VPGWPACEPKKLTERLAACTFQRGNVIQQNCAREGIQELWEEPTALSIEGDGVTTFGPGTPHRAEAVAMRSKNHDGLCDR